jgi:hypothetical protein
MYEWRRLGFTAGLICMIMEISIIGCKRITGPVKAGLAKEQLRVAQKKNGP